MTRNEMAFQIMLAHIGQSAVTRNPEYLVKHAFEVLAEFEKHSSGAGSAALLPPDPGPASEDVVPTKCELGTHDGPCVPVKQHKTGCLDIREHDGECDTAPVLSVVTVTAAPTPAKAPQSLTAAPVPADGRCIVPECPAPRDASAKGLRRYACRLHVEYVGLREEALKRGLVQATRKQNGEAR